MTTVRHVLDQKVHYRYHQPPHNPVRPRPCRLKQCPQRLREVTQQLRPASDALENRARHRRRRGVSHVACSVGLARVRCASHSPIGGALNEYQSAHRPRHRHSHRRGPRLDVLSFRRDTQSNDRADNASGDGSGYASTHNAHDPAHTVAADG
jgi:hypothetical protein